MKTEKERRIYYQDIVYHVCYALDLIDGKKPGHGIVCGTADEPNNNVFDRMKALVKSMKASTKVPDLIRELITHLPDNTVHDTPDWNWCWDELSDDSQDMVKDVRKKAIDYLKEA